jgi:hypothetical protein
MLATMAYSKLEEHEQRNPEIGNPGMGIVDRHNSRVTSCAVLSGRIDSKKSLLHHRSYRRVESITEY